MIEVAGAPPTTKEGAGAPRWVAWVFLGLLVLPFDPFWVDFEQVRRALLLVLTGALLLVFPYLPRVRNEGAWFAFTAFLAVAAMISVRSLQPWEAYYRIAHFLALLFALRLGAALRDRLAAPLTALLGVTSLFGLVQRMGLGEIAGYGRACEPVSVFGNLNVASEWTAIAMLAVVVLPAPRRTLQLAALALAGAYLVVNGSRSGMIGGGIGLLVFLAKRRRVDALIEPGLVLGGAGIGLLLAMGFASPDPTDPRAREALELRAGKTLEVRLEIAKGCTALFAERPLFGWGPGQFQVQYPRVRTQEEIDLSSDKRRFATEVRSAHDDWIELLVEGGLPILLLFAGALFALQRGNRKKEQLLPLFVLLLIMFARSPLANAPAVVAALLPVATALPPPGKLTIFQRIRRARLAWLTRALGLGFLALGLLPLVAHMAFAPYLAAKARGDRPDMRCAMTAHRWMGWEPRWLEVLSQEHLIYGNLGAASKAAAMAVELRPHHPHLLKLLGETLSNAGRWPEAIEVARHGLLIDPQHPELRALLSTCLMFERCFDEAVAAVCVDPHERLRGENLEGLERHFRSLARECERTGEVIGAARCRVELAFFAILGTLGKQQPAAFDATSQRLQTMLLAMRDADTLSSDARLYVLTALHFIALDDPEEAVKKGVEARLRGLTLLDWQRALIGDERLQKLREHAVWDEVLRRQQ